MSDMVCAGVDPSVKVVSLLMIACTYRVQTQE
jgi:hypothetical protein